MYGVTIPEVCPLTTSEKLFASRSSFSIPSASPSTFLSRKRTAWRVIASAIFWVPSHTRVGHGILISCGGILPPSLPIKTGAILLAPLAGNYANSAEIPACTSIPAWCRVCGCWLTTAFTGPLGARARLASQVSTAAPISSDRIGRSQ